jgi:hypothetical protein
LQLAQYPQLLDDYHRGKYSDAQVEQILKNVVKNVGVKVKEEFDHLERAKLKAQDDADKQKKLAKKEKDKRQKTQDDSKESAIQRLYISERSKLSREGQAKKLRKLAKENDITLNKANRGGAKSNSELVDELIALGVLDDNALKKKARDLYEMDEVQSSGSSGSDYVSDLDEDIVSPASSLSPPRLSRIPQLHHSPAYPLRGNGNNTINQDGMSTDDINKVMGKYKEYKGCIGSDQISSVILPQVKPHTRICWVQNIETSHQAGSHWVSVLIDGRPDGSHSVEYYNPLGSEGGARGEATPPVFFKHIKPVLQKLEVNSYMKFKQNAITDQSNTSSNCGEFSCHFLIDRLRNKSFAEATGWNKKGEKEIELWKKKQPLFKYIDGFKNGQSGEGFKEIYEGAKTIGKKVIGAVLNAKPRSGFSPNVRKLLTKYGNNKIVDIKVYREPINSVINKVLNWVTLGTFQQNLKDLDYESAMHLFMYITLDNGTTIRFDKNHIIEAKIQHVPHHPTAEVRNIGNIKNVLLNNFFEKGIKSVGESNYFLYDSKSNNCQKWIIDNLQANGLMTGELKQFIYQDPEKTYKNLGLLATVNKAITDVAAKADHVIYGTGKSVRLVNNTPCKCH